MTDVKGLTRAEIRRRQRRSLIVSATEDQLAAEGIVGTTLAKVGERAGLSKGALYYYVDGRDDLLVLVLEDVLADICARAAADAEGEASPLARLVHFARAHVGVSERRPAGLVIVANVDLLAGHDRAADLLRAHEQVARDLVAEAVTAGELRPVHPVAAGAALFGSLNTLLRSFDPDGPLTLEELADEVIGLLLDGWRPR